jgi:hypothetical protein
MHWMFGYLRLTLAVTRNQTQATRMVSYVVHHCQLLHCLICFLLTGPATNNTSIGGGGHKDKSNNAVGLRASLVTILIFGFATVTWLL